METYRNVKNELIEVTTACLCLSVA